VYWIDVVALANTDILIYRWGPAGLAAALATLGRGFNVIVADGIVPRADKACGEGLMPDALAAFVSLIAAQPSTQVFPQAARAASGAPLCIE